MNLDALIESTLWRNTSDYTQNFATSIGTNGRKVIDLRESTMYAPTSYEPVTFKRESGDSLQSPTVDIQGTLKADQVNFSNGASLKYNSSLKAMEMSSGSKKAVFKLKSPDDFESLTSSQKATATQIATLGDIAELENRLSINKEKIEILVDILKLYPEMEDKIDQIEDIENEIKDEEG